MTSYDAPICYDGSEVKIGDVVEWAMFDGWSGNVSGQGCIVTGLCLVSYHGDEVWCVMLDGNTRRLHDVLDVRHWEDKE